MRGKKIHFIKMSWGGELVWDVGQHKKKYSYSQTGTIITDHLQNKNAKKKNQSTLNIH